MKYQAPNYTYTIFSDRPAENVVDLWEMDYPGRTIIHVSAREGSIQITYALNADLEQAAKVNGQPVKLPRTYSSSGLIRASKFKEA